MVSLDALTGVALLDLGEAEGLPAPATVASLPDMSLGSDVIYVGYVFSDQGDPNQAIAEGIINQIRSWDPGQVTFISTDARVPFGFRGVVVTAAGNVVATSTSDASMAEWHPAIDSLLKRAQEEERLPPTESWSSVLASAGEGATKIETILRDEGPNPIWLLNAGPGESGSVSAESAGDVAIEVLGPDGSIIAYVDDGGEGLETVSFDIELAGPHFVRLQRFGEEPIDVRVESSHTLVDLATRGPSTPIELGTSLEGAIDFGGDSDVYVVELETGTEILVSVQSVSIDSYVCVSQVASPEPSNSCDDDSGGGFFGLDSELAFSADEPGTYTITVWSYDERALGGYLLLVESDA